MKKNWTAIHGIQEHRVKIDVATAYHLAGHATAICLGNRKKNLPDVHFQILINQHGSNEQSPRSHAYKQEGYTARIEGGRLIQHLHLLLVQYLRSLPSQQQKDEYKRAFEADIINLLVGPLAEAKYVALQEGKALNPNLVNIIGLSSFDGRPDSSLIVEYLDCFLFEQKDYDRLKEIFKEAFSFINNESNWYAISALAAYILNQPCGCINFEDVMSIVESRLAA